MLFDVGAKEDVINRRMRCAHMTNLAERWFPRRQKKTTNENPDDFRKRCFPNATLEHHSCTVAYCLVFWKLVFCHNSDNPLVNTGLYI